MIEPKIINYIDIDIMEKICHPIAVALFDSKIEPIPSFSNFLIFELESALSNPRYSYYPTFCEKAAILYYTMIKNHPFVNGNKRMATATLLVFLYINEFWLNGDDKKNEDILVSLAQRIAKSEGSADKDSFLIEVNNWLRDNIVKRITDNS